MLQTLPQLSYYNKVILPPNLRIRDQYAGCVNGGCEEPWECNCANGWGGMHCNQPHNTTNFPYPTSANNLRASPRGAQESTGNSLKNKSSLEMASCFEKTCTIKLLYFTYFTFLLLHIFDSLTLSIKKVYQIQHDWHVNQAIIACVKNSRHNQHTLWRPEAKHYQSN